jgi:hypothetical protein
MKDRHFNKHLLRACLEQDRYRFHPSAWKRFRELQISLNDILHVLRNGTIEQEPEFDETYGNWRFAAHGKTVDLQELKIKFVFVEAECVLILTIAE